MFLEENFINYLQPVPDVTLSYQQYIIFHVSYFLVAELAHYKIHANVKEMIMVHSTLTHKKRLQQYSITIHQTISLLKPHKNAWRYQEKQQKENQHKISYHKIWSHITISQKMTQLQGLKIAYTFLTNHNKGYQLQAPCFPEFPRGLVSLMGQGASTNHSHPLSLFQTQALT
jgi:hypothetical protein